MSAATAATVPLALGAGRLFADRYEILALLGEGGMGAVYRALDHELGEQIALKLLRPETAETEGALERFRREAKLARRVTHENVARTFDLGAFDGTRFLTMELIEGESLARVLSRGRLDLVDALRIGTEIARGLAAAHSVGVVHRDLKPDNVMLAGTRVVITDFGIARQTGPVPNAGTVGLILGTPAYMAPEQVEGRELDGRADIFALGIVLFEMLTGGLPFEGDTPFALAAARLGSDAPDVRTREPRVPDSIATLVADALARRRDARPDAQVLLTRLDELRAGRFAAAPTPLSTPRQARDDVGVALIPLSGEASLASLLSDAIGDALCKLRGARVVTGGAVTGLIAPHTREGALDAAALGRALSASWIVSGSARRSGERARVALRMFDVERDVQAWAERVDVTVDDFELEDVVSARIVEAMRTRLGVAPASSLPADPAVHTMFKRARELYHQFLPTSIADAVAIYEDVHARSPNDALIMAALGAALVRSWMFVGTTDAAVVRRAEEMALRALAADPRCGEALLTIGIIRWQFGELAAAARAFEDAIERQPSLEEAHSYLGQMLGELGHLERALQHLQLAGRLEPRHRASVSEQVRLLDLAGRKAEIDVLVARLIELDPSGREVMPLLLRTAMWRQDGGQIRQVLEHLRAMPARERDYYTPMAEVTLAALEGRPAEDLYRKIAEVPHPSLRRKSYFFQLSAELRALSGDRDGALDSLERAAELVLIDVFWLDRCPLLARLRDDPRFARVRAVTAARAATIGRA